MKQATTGGSRRLVSGGGLAVALSLGLTLPACTEAGSSWSGVVRDSAGVRIVENASGGVWTEAAAWVAETGLEIGEANSEAAYEFGNVKGLAVLSDGSVAVLDALAAEVRVFDAAGRYARTIGHPGKGPGELSAYGDAMWSESGDTLVVVDMGNRVINRYAADGTFARVVRLPFEGGFTYDWIGDGAGQAWHNARRFAGRTADSLEQLQIHDRDGNLVREVASWVARESMSDNGSGGVRLQLFSPETRWTLAADGGVWSGATDRYRITHRDVSGRVDRILVRPAEAVAVSEADRLFYVDAMVRLWQGRVSPAMRPQLRDATTFAPVFPLFESLTTGPNATLWIQPFRPASKMPADERSTFDPERDLGSPFWNVFGADGRYLGDVLLPVRFTPYFARESSIWGVARNSLDVQRVIRVDLRRRDGGLIDTG